LTCPLGFSIYAQVALAIVVLAACSVAGARVIAVARNPAPPVHPISIHKDSHGEYEGSIRDTNKLVSHKIDGFDEN